MNQVETVFLARLAIGEFSIDEQGRVWRHRIRVSGSRMGTPSVERDIPPRRAETTATKDHLRIQFQHEGRKAMVYAHRVVWMVHNQSDIPEGFEINHKDGNPANNDPSNLELTTRRGNVVHAMRVLGKMRRDGVHNNQAKLTAEQALDIYRLAKERVMPQRLIALQFGVSETAVQDILYGRHWKSLPRD